MLSFPNMLFLDNGLLSLSAKFRTIALLLLPILFCACEQGDPPQTTTSIVVQMFEGPEFDAMQPTVEYWNKNYLESTGIHVNVVMLERVGYMGKMKTQLIAGLSEPDIVHPYSLQLGEIGEFLVPLNEYLEDSDVNGG